MTPANGVGSLAVLDVNYSARWKHDTKTRTQVVRRNADVLLFMAADRAFQNCCIMYKFYALGAGPLVLQRKLRAIAKGHDALLHIDAYS